MKFSEMESLTTKIAIYVPSTLDIDKPVDNAEQVEKTACFLSDLFGGCTSFDASGYWIDSNKKLIKERPAVVYAYTTEDKAQAAEGKIIEYVMEMKKEMHQECISVEYNNRLYFV